MTDRRAFEIRDEDEVRCSRRGWLGGVALLALGATGAGAPVQATRADLDLIEAIRERAQAAGIKNVGSGLSEHYLGVGDASPAFRAQALKLCEELAATLLKHFQFKGFELALPRDRPGVVVLADKGSYEKFKGAEVGESEGGSYDLETNCLTVFDFLDEKVRGGDKVRRLNTFTLVHEAVHQFTFNAGLLDRKGDVPLAVSEGLATYAELWTIKSPHVGQMNAYRLDVMKRPGQGEGWFPVAELLSTDTLFNDRASEQLAYAEAWLLIHELMQTSSGRKKLQAYFQAIRSRRDMEHRDEDAEKAFGSLVKLDNALKKRARLL